MRVNIEQALKGLFEAAAEKLEDNRVLTQKIAFTLEQQSLHNFALQGRPQWMGWSKAYAMRRAKQRGGGQILRLTGMLQSSVMSEFDDTSATVGAGSGASAAYAAIHQFGGKIQKHARQHELHFKQDSDGTVGNRFVKKKHSNFSQQATIGAHTITIPARPFLPITADGGLTDYAENAVTDDALWFLEQAF